MFKSSDPKPREGTETRHRHDGGAALDAVVRPKTPRGDGNLCEVTSPTPSKRLSSDPKPREGTETCIRKVRTLETLPTCRQTQNPERGRKLEIQHHIRSCGMLPKSSDPKPREGTETRGTVPPGPAPSGSSDPKPREGTETRGTVPPGPAPSGSSDPKPREGTETRKRSTSLTILFSRRQTQNPERGRKHFERELVHSPPFRSSDPKPREGTETPRGWRMRCARKCRQTQNPERGRKLRRLGRHRVC